ncbi:site-specific DNA-methyltransferase [Lactococcus lactis subsp. lactis]|uniref:site-specific DNA-methyltransferase n=1 Tax=Lactococcus lactis TaxID=1358 RepID=UPI00223AFB4A|nr:site-specific DNA-methyltransferase [Lactococcus lactis]MCT0061666.1 site-specific DNA-methyltransferase [Lactococcus lactis subsp. lactis]MCT0137662.1 site-specific DNA-methyltransferase [Lactococcus lactis subsp. lactis]
MPKIPFNDRPHKNEKQESIDYVKSLIEQARTDARDSDIPKLEKLIQLLNSKKYGLVWEEHAESVEDEMKTKIPVFVEDESKKINDNPNSEDFNFLLEGDDNLHSLHLLEKTHLGKIDVIYIDPPYNTGNKDFKYNDDFVDSEDTFRHSKWLSFMERRLCIAKRLLGKDGLIFISIDDKEFGQLKVLMDDIFGEENFVNNIVVKMSEATGVKMTHATKRLPKLKEYILVYKNGNPKFKKLQIPKEKWDKEYKILVEGVSFDELSRLKEILNSDDSNEELITEADQICKKMVFSNVSKILGNAKTTEAKDIIKYENAWRILRDVATTGGAKQNADFKRKTNFNSAFVIVTPQKKKYLIKNGYNLKSAQPRIKLLFADEYLTTNPGDFWQDIKTTGLDNEGFVSFTNGKKPLKAIKRVIELNDKLDSLVLDFFAGSGTTGQAVTELNAEDGGNRKFILATNNENNIAEEVTYKRMKSVSTGTGNYGAHPMNLKYFKTDFVIKEEFPDVSLEYELLKYVTPLVELEFGIDITNPKVQIVLNEEQLESLIDNKELISNSTIFMHPDVFRDDKQNQVLQDLQIKIQEIPNYFFGAELWSK